MSCSVRTTKRLSADTIVKKSMSERILTTLPTACLPPAVLAPLVEIVATMVLSSLTASKSKKPPERSGTRSRLNRFASCGPNQFCRTQSSTSSWTRVSAIFALSHTMLRRILMHHEERATFAATVGHPMRVQSVSRRRPASSLARPLSRDVPQATAPTARSRGYCVSVP